MVDLPKRQSRIDVDVSGTDAILHVRPMNDEQQMIAASILRRQSQEQGAAPRVEHAGGGWYRIIQNGEEVDKVQGKEKAREVLEETVQSITVDPDDLRKRISEVSPLLEIAREQIVGAENVTIGGDPFDPDDEGHIDRIPAPWATAVMQALVREAFMTDETGKG